MLLGTRAGGSTSPPLPSPPLPSLLPLPPLLPLSSPRAVQGMCLPRAHAFVLSLPQLLFLVAVTPVMHAFWDIPQDTPEHLTDLVHVRNGPSDGGLRAERRGGVRSGGTEAVRRDQSPVAPAWGGGSRPRVGPLGGGRAGE